MRRRVSAAGHLAWRIVTGFVRDECPLMAAAISYYTVFAMPPLLALLALLAGKFLAPAELQTLLFDQVTSLAGTRSAGQIIEVVQNVSRPDLSGPAAVLGLVGVTFGATSAFVQLQRAMNRTWGVAPDPRRGDVRTFMVKRAVSLFMILVVGVMILLLVTVSTLLSVFHDAIRYYAPPALATGALPVADAIASLLVVTGLFTAMLRNVPDAVIRWRDALAGGVFTGVLFTAGKLAIGYYLGRSDLASVYGAAGSLAVALLWVYYSAGILLLGAEFTKEWTCRRGAAVEPRKGAVRVEWRERPMDEVPGPGSGTQLVEDI
ncbi:MAG TPA: YihY/virulence factor BrkB family protein [Longimicrobiales bacterium]|nr:YihY/virulence factor BrkB family protein [Longimicrobiales bacterium]